MSVAPYVIFMEFGVVVGSSWSVKQIVESAIVADDCGLDFLLVTDHYLIPSSNESVDAWTILAALAVKTERIRLGTCVTPIPFRPPQILAKVVATVDQLSNGRVVLGVGAGWHKPEFDAYSTWDDGKVRVAKTREGMELMQKFWTSNEPFDFEGKYYRAKGALLEPKPIQKPHPPFWFGTTGPYMLKLAKRDADGWVPPVPGVPMQVYQTVLAALREQPQKRDRKPIKLMFNGTLPEITETIPEFVKMGFDGAILARTPREETAQAIQKMAKEIIPNY